MIKKTFIIFFSICSLCFADATVQTARGPQFIKDGTTAFRIVRIDDEYKVVYHNSMWSGTIDGLNNVTFKNWNFSRTTPHTIVFTHSTNLTFIQCNLNNVEIPLDSTVEDSLTIHQRQYEMLGKKYKEVECGDDKTRTYRIDETDVDLIEEKLKDLGMEKSDIDKVKDNVKDKYILEGKETVIIKGRKREVLISTEDTPYEKTYKRIKSFTR